MLKKIDSLLTFNNTKILFIISFVFFLSSCGFIKNERYYERFNVLGETDVEGKWDHELKEDIFKSNIKYKTLDQELVKDLWSYISYEYDTKIVDKNKSSFMKALGIFLSTFGIMSKKEFLEDFVTTIGKTIYVPFSIGKGKLNENDLLNQIFLCVHEHEHVVQHNKLGRKYSIRYVLRSSQRAKFETEAYSTSLEIYYWFFKDFLSTDYLSQLLIFYNCKEKDILQSKKALDGNIELIKKGKIISEVSEKAIIWLEQNAKNLQVKE